MNYKWTTKEIETLREDISNFEKTVNEGFIKHQNFDEYPNTKVALIGKKQVKIIYRIVDSEQIEIALFWHCKQDPQKLKNLLK
ncbi:MAG: hypothetical protein QM564_10200 [Bergeyella sp.]